MIFQDLLAQLKNLNVEESRTGTGDYFEAVIAKDGLDSLHAMLTAYFGSPLKPEGHPPSAEAIQHAAPHGGIRKEQTMYFRPDGDSSECALIWPWGSGSRVTVKVIRFKGADPDSGWADRLKNIFFRKS